MLHFSSKCSKCCLVHKSSMPPCFPEAVSKQKDGKQLPFPTASTTAFFPSTWDRFSESSWQVFLVPYTSQLCHGYWRVFLRLGNAEGCLSAPAIERILLAVWCSLLIQITVAQLNEQTLQLNSLDKKNEMYHARQHTMLSEILEP